MTFINSITNSAKQTIGLVLNDSSKVTLNLEYISNQQGWFYSFTYGNFTVNNRRMVTSPNLLREFRGIIPFGLACSTSDGYEPIFIDDFSSGRAAFYLLDADDVQTVEDDIIGVYPK